MLCHSQNASMAVEQSYWRKILQLLFLSSASDTRTTKDLGTFYSSVQWHHSRSYWLRLLPTNDKIHKMIKNKRVILSLIVRVDMSNFFSSFLHFYPEQFGMFWRNLSPLAYIEFCLLVLLFCVRRMIATVDVRNNWCNPDTPCSIDIPYFFGGSVLKGYCVCCE